MKKEKRKIHRKSNQRYIRKKETFSVEQDVSLTTD